jgi:hypothetical protein
VTSERTPRCGETKVNEADCIPALLTRIQKLRKKIRSIIEADEDAEYQLNQCEEMLRQGAVPDDRGGNDEEYPWRWNGDKLKVHLDHCDPFTLSFQPGHLFAYLASIAIDVQNHDKSWRPRKDVVEHLTTKSGHQIPVKRLNQVIYRLRRELKRANLDHDIIQSSRRSGVRLVLPHSAPNAMSGDARR